MRHFCECTKYFFLCYFLFSLGYASIRYLTIQVFRGLLPHLCGMQKLENVRLPRILINTRVPNELLLTGASDTIASPLFFGVCCRADGYGEGKKMWQGKVGKYLSIMKFTCSCRDSNRYLQIHNWEPYGGRR